MAKDNNNYILLYHRGENMTISDFVDRNYIYGLSPKELFDSNKDFIWQQMTDDDKINQKNTNGIYPENSSDLTIDMILPTPCTLRVNPNQVTAELAITQTNAQIDTDDFYAFEEKKIQDIYQNEGFSVNDFSKKNLDCEVFGWFKSFYAFSESTKEVNSLDKSCSQFSDLSKYVISLSTSVTKNGGSFIIKLPIISSRSLEVLNFFDKNKKFKFTQGVKEKNAIYNFKNNYYSKSSFNNIESNYFNWLASSNDLLFMSFEKLKMEKIRDKKDKDDFDIESMISEGIYDMIGLIDEVKVISSSQNSEGYVEITGRDLMKLIIEDGSFFFNLSTTAHPSSVFGNTSNKQGDIKDSDFMHNTYNDPLNRLRKISGEIGVFSNKTNMDIDFILKGVISQLANIEVVPNFVFDSWGQDRTTFKELTSEKK